MPTIEGQFDTRREAEMAVERLVQEHDVLRTAIRIAPAGAANSAGEERAGSDEAAGGISPDARSDAALEGKILVSADVPGEKAGKVRSAMREFAGGTT